MAATKLPPEAVGLLAGSDSSLSSEECLLSVSLMVKALEEIETS